MERTESSLLHGTLTHEVLACAFDVHRHLGPGLLEGVYKACLAHELSLRGLAFDIESLIPVHYKGVTLETIYRADLIVEKTVLLELKAVERLLPIHEAQALTYLRLTRIHVGLLINFNVRSLKDGIRRLIL